MTLTGRIILNSVLLVVLLAVVGAGWFLRARADQPNVEVLPDMAHSARYNAYAENPNFADGKTLQPPAAGSIARGYLPLHYAATPEDALRAGQELASPVSLGNANAVQRGGTVFANYCVACHGGAGTGMGPVAQRGYPPPPSLLAPRAVQMKDGQMFHILTYGQNNMPSYAAQLSRADRWNAVVYVRSLQQQAATRAAAVPAKLAAPPAPPQGGR
jgi:mono/diheme cytochrome c family protein